MTNKAGTVHQLRMAVAVSLACKACAMLLDADSLTGLWSRMCFICIQPALLCITIITVFSIKLLSEQLSWPHHHDNFCFASHCLDGQEMLFCCDILLLVSVLNRLL